VTAPYSSALLNEPVSAEEITIPRPGAAGAQQRSAAISAHATTVGGTAEEQARREEAAYAAGARAAGAGQVTSRPVSYPVAPPQYAPALAPAFAAPQPQVVYVAAPGRNGGGIGNGMSAVALGLVVLIIAIVAGLAAYVITQQNAPSAQEAAQLQAVAGRESFLNGQMQGVQIGQTWGASAQGAVAAANAKIAGERAYNKAVAAGTRAGANSYRPTPYAPYRGYGGRRYNGYGNGSLSQGLADAQNLANITNSPVDVEVY